jgi:hypothetical protein
MLPVAQLAMACPLPSASTAAVVTKDRVRRRQIRLWVRFIPILLALIRAAMSMNRPGRMPGRPDREVRADVRSLAIRDGVLQS